MSGAADSLIVTRLTSEIPLRRIVALHPTVSKAKVAALAADMKKNGWKGRPLLSIAFGEEVFAWTGSHRLAAASAAGLEKVPVDRYVIATAGIEQVLHMFEAESPWDLTEGGDRDRLNKLLALQKAGYSGLEPAIELMEQEPSE